MGKKDNDILIVIGVIALALIYGGSFSTIWAPQTSFTSDWVLESGNLDVNAASATVPFNSLYNNGQLLLRVKSLQPEPGKACSDYALIRNDFIINSGCGDIIDASGAELVAFDSTYCSVLMTLEKPFTEGNLPGCYASYRPAGWSDGINAMVEGSAAFSLTGIDVETPVENPDTPQEQAAKKDVIITVVDVATGETIANATVQIGSETVQTDGNGEAMISVVPGLYQVTVTSGNYGAVSSQVEIGSESQTIVTVKLESGLNYAPFFWIIIAIVIVIIAILIVKR